MGSTIAEKILARVSGRDSVRPGDEIAAKPDATPVRLHGDRRARRGRGYLGYVRSQIRNQTITLPQMGNRCKTAMYS